MSYNQNFDVTARIEDGNLNVTGTSSDEDKDLRILSRHFLVQQGKKIEARQAEETTEGNWGAVRPLPATGFTEGAAVVLGTETYYLKRTGAPPMFVSMTWSQSITIT
jgi:hypothetical protein